MAEKVYWRYAELCDAEKQQIPAHWERKDHVFYAPKNGRFGESLPLSKVQLRPNGMGYVPAAPAA